MARQGRKKRPGKPRVEVRVTRRGCALRVDGTLASWYAPGLPVTGSVWDALAAPILALPPARRRNVLVLGLGGGSVARVLRAVAPRVRIVGVETNREVLRAARRWFDLDEVGVEVVEADAVAYLSRSRRRYDLVVEDVFVGRGRAVHKPDWLPRPGLALAAARLSPQGVLVSNTLDESRAVAAELGRLFPSRLSIEVAGYDNRVFAASRRRLSAGALRDAVRADPVLRVTLPKFRLRGLSASRPSA